jgi:hypothetical protein
MQENNLDELFETNGVQFTGTGPESYDPTAGGRKSRRDIHVEELEEDYDPYNMLGFGFQAYFSTLTIFGWVFVLMTLLMLPAFYWYAQVGGLKNVTHGYYNSVFMLGNFGFNKAVCDSTYVQLQSTETQIACEIGVMSPI